MYRLSYDGTIVDEPEFLVMGGQADALTSSLRQTLRRRLCPYETRCGSPSVPWAPWAATDRARELPATQLEVAVLDRTRTNRKFRRYAGAALTALLPAASAEPVAAPAPAPADTPPHDVALDQPAGPNTGGSAG